jgi:hypothetical protein
MWSARHEHCFARAREQPSPSRHHGHGAADAMHGGDMHGAAREGRGGEVHESSGRSLWFTAASLCFHMNIGVNQECRVCRCSFLWYEKLLKYVPEEKGEDRESV